MSLANARVSAMLPAQDLDRARSFYADKLGLKPMAEQEGDAMYELAGGTRFGLFKTMGAPSGDHTQIGFEVEDFDSVIESLRANGVTFEDYDFPGLKTENGIATMGPMRGAWVKDSEGNLLAITEPLPI